jgi:hypothetical protein
MIADHIMMAPAQTALMMLAGVALADEAEPVHRVNSP